MWRTHPSQNTRNRLRDWGYQVSTAGDWITVAGHGCIHRWHGWAAVPSVTSWTGAFDGAASPNPGPAAWGAWLDTPLGDPAWRGSGACGVATNNVAEWSGLVALLKAARSFGVERLSIHGDSQHVVCQFSRHYTSHEPRTRRLAKEAHRVARTITVEIAWWPRAENGRADLLSREGLRSAAPSFDAHRLEPSKGHQVIAHGTHDYVIDTQIGTCTCPAFRFRQGPCKHLLAARAALHAEARGHH